MLNLRFSKLPKHRKFNYSPIFYNEEKDELHSRVNDIKREMGELDHSAESVKDNIHRVYKTRQIGTHYESLPLQKYYSIRIIIIALVLGLISYLLWDSNILEIIFGHLNK